MATGTYVPKDRLVSIQAPEIESLEILLDELVKADADYLQIHVSNLSTLVGRLKREGR